MNTFPFPSELREAIASSGMTMREVAETLGIPYRTMQDWRAGRRIPAGYVRADIIERINNINIKQEDDKMNNYWTTESWGDAYPPENADEIIAAANEMIDAGADSEALWARFCQTDEVGGVIAKYNI